MSPMTRAVACRARPSSCPISVFRPPPVTAWRCPLSGRVPGCPPRTSRPSRSNVPRVTHCLPPRITAMPRCAVGYGEDFSSRALVVAFVVLLHEWPSACCRAGLIGSPCTGHAGIVSPTAARRRRARRGRSPHHFFAMPFSSRLAWAPQMSANGPTACMFLYSCSNIAPSLAAVVHAGSVSCARHGALITIRDTIKLASGVSSWIACMAAVRYSGVCLPARVWSASAISRIAV